MTKLAELNASLDSSKDEFFQELSLLMWQHGMRISTYNNQPAFFEVDPDDPHMLLDPQVAFACGYTYDRNGVDADLRVSRISVRDRDYALVDPPPQEEEPND